MITHFCKYEGPPIRTHTCMQHTHAAHIHLKQCETRGIMLLPPLRAMHRAKAAPTTRVTHAAFPCTGL